MRRLFWRGMVVGSALGAILAMAKRPRQKITGLSGLDNSIKGMYARHVPDRVAKGVSRTVEQMQGIIKRRSK